MHINSLMDMIEKESLSFSQAIYTFPCTSFKVEVDTMTEKAYRKWAASEVVVNAGCSFIMEGVAHDVVLEFSTFDGEAKIVEVK